MRIITLNLNGIRAAARKGFYAWLARQRADLVCLQETRAQEAQLGDRVFAPAGFGACFCAAQKKGYSGVALYHRRQPEALRRGLGGAAWRDFDEEGRWVQADYKNLSVVSLYMPSGTSGDARQAYKFDVLARMKPLLRKLRKGRRECVICGDINIAHREIDLKNWRANQKHSGFLPAERAWMDWLLEECGFVDVFRALEPRAGQYTWWSNRGQAWAKNVGWRIDYQLATPGLAARARRARIYKARRFSDHAPLVIDYDFQL